MKTDEEKPQIIIADNQFLIIEGLKSALSDSYSIMATVNSPQELNVLLLKEKCDLIIINYEIFDTGGLDEFKKIKKRKPDTVILILSENIDRDELIELNKCGIKNILHKNTDKEALFACLDAALKGKKYYSDIYMENLFDEREKKYSIEPGKLTASEIEIIRLIARGLTTKEIAIKKILSYHTIMTHRKNILKKLGVSNASELILVAGRMGILDIIEYHI
ncbi:MAG TPA: response regulator transcription factor [Bacteroidales bacterium]|nr:response regulator transcription factor [Bacteroidales bacterium]